MLFWGKLLQGIGIMMIPLCCDFNILTSVSAIQGIGTALIYLTFFSTLAQESNPERRAESIGTFRL